MAELIAETTGCSVPTALERLQAEYRRPGSSVGDDFRKDRLTPYIWNDDLLAFYSRTDGFLYELAIWNCNKIKKSMRSDTVDWLHPLLSDGLPSSPSRVLTIGDGLGFDGLALAKAGHQVTYFDLPGLTQQFAANLFRRSGVSIEIITDLSSVPDASYDAVVCLDVLEHIPNPGQLLENILRPLRADGCLIAHAPFHMILPPFPTHLRENRQYAGSLDFYRSRKLRLAGGCLTWNPLLFTKTDCEAPRLRHACSMLRHLGIRTMGGILRLGRLTSFPFWLFVIYQRRQNRWFTR